MIGALSKGLRLPLLREFGRLRQNVKHGRLALRTGRKKNGRVKNRRDERGQKKHGSIILGEREVSK